MADRCSHEWQRLFVDVPTEEDLELAGRGTPLRKWLEERKAEYYKRELNAFYLCKFCMRVGAAQPDSSIRIIIDEATADKYRQQASEWKANTVKDQLRSTYTVSDKKKIRDIRSLVVSPSDSAHGGSQPIAGGQGASNSKVMNKRDYSEQVLAAFDSLIKEIEAQIGVLGGVAAEKSRERKWADAKSAIEVASGAEAVLVSLNNAKSEWSKLPIRLTTKQE